MTYRPKHFTLAELVDPWFLAMPEDEVWAMIDENALRAIDGLRDRFGRIVINGLFKGHVFKESGLRRTDTKTGSKQSMHRYLPPRKSSGFDLHFLDSDEITAYNWIISNQPEAYAMGIRRVEDISITGKQGIAGWLHIDSKDTGTEWVGKIQIVKP